MRAGAGGTTARRIRVDEIERAQPRVPVLVAQADRNLVGDRTRETRALARKGQIVGFAHVEIEIDRIQRDECRQQGRRAGGGPAAGDQAPDRDEPCADATGEGRGDVTIFDVELGVANLGFGVVDRGLRGELLGHALVDRLGGSEIASLQRLGANELAVGESEARRCGPELGGRLGELDLVGARIDDEKQVALVDDLPWPRKPIRVSTSRRSGVLTVTVAGGIGTAAAWPPSR